MDKIESLDKELRNIWFKTWITLQRYFLRGVSFKILIGYQFSFSSSSSLRSSRIFGLSPGGLATDGYDGHVFWDQETWMFPPLLLLHQDLARTCLAYRFERLQAAEEKAKKYGFRGSYRENDFV